MCALRMCCALPPEMISTQPQRPGGIGSQTDTTMTVHPISRAATDYSVRTTPELAIHSHLPGMHHLSGGIID